MQRRDLLKMGVGAGIGVLSSNLLKSQSESHELRDFIAGLGSFEASVTKYEKQLRSGDIEIIKQRGRELTKSGETYSDYSQNFFLQTEFVDEDKKISRIPLSIRKLLGPILPGLIAQESKFKKDAQSSAGAIGSTQVVEDYSIYKKEVYLRFLPLQVRESFRMFETIRHTVVTNIDLDGFARQYGLSQSEMERFVVLCMINSYNTGQNRMVSIVNTFQKNISPSLASERKDQSVLGLFHLMTELAYRFQWKKGYGKDSYEYPRKCLAFSQALNTGTISSGILDSPQILARRVQSVVDDILSYGGNIVAGTLLAGATMVGGDLLEQKQEKLPLGVKLDRRQFLKAGVALASAVAGSALEKFSFEGEEESPSKPQLSKERYIRNAPFVLGKLEEYYQTHDSFFSKIPLSVQRQKAQEIQNNSRYRRNYSKRVLPILKSLPPEKQSRITDGEVEQGLKRRGLISVEAQNELWRLYGIGDDTQVNPKFAFLVKEAHKTLHLVTKKFQEKLKESGMSDAFQIRPVITSLIRTQEQNTKAGGSPDSVHLIGRGMDVSFVRFDLIDTDTQMYVDLKDATDRKALTIREYAQSLMLQVIAELDQTEDLIFTNETLTKSPHYHITVF